MDSVAVPGPPAPPSPPSSHATSNAVKALCAVCGDRATRLRYSHYGATSCFSCRAFFRRAVEKGSQAADGGACSNGGLSRCEVTVATRKKCPACRLRKCREVGMKHSREGSGRGRQQQQQQQMRRQRKMTSFFAGPAAAVSAAAAPEAAPEETAASVLPDPRSFEYDHGEEPYSFPRDESIAAVLAVPTPAEDAAKMNEIFRLDRSQSFHIGEAVGEATKSILRSFVQSARSGGAVEFNSICWAYSVGIRKLVRFAQSLEDFTNLPRVSDKKALLLHNLDPMFNVRVGHFFTCGLDNFVEQMETLSIFDVSFIKRAFAWMPKIPPMRWDQLFRTPWANSVEHERKFDSLMRQLGELGMMESPQDAGGPLASLFSAVVLFSSDGMEEEGEERGGFSGEQARQDIRRIREKYMSLLYRHLVRTRGPSRADADAALFESAVRSLREMADIMKNKTIKVSAEWPQLENLV